MVLKRTQKTYFFGLVGLVSLILFFLTNSIPSFYRIINYPENAYYEWLLVENSKLRSGKDVREQAENTLLDIRPLDTLNSGYRKVSTNVLIDSTTNQPVIYPEPDLYDNSSSDDTLSSILGVLKNAILYRNISQTYKPNLLSNETSPTNPKLIELIRNNFIFPPSHLDYDLTEPTKEDFSMGQFEAIKPHLDLSKTGFFVECGALDGETRSNSLILERKYGWSGLLIEGDPNNFNLLLKKHRKASSINACLSTDPHPTILRFHQDFNLGRILKPEEKSVPKKKNIEMPCYDLQSLMIALNQSEIDYFSLDVEGSELGVLKTIPFDKIFIKVMSVEFVHTHEGRSALLDFVLSKGYNYVSNVTNIHSLANDYIFVHSSLITRNRHLPVMN